MRVLLGIIQILFGCFMLLGFFSSQSKGKNTDSLGFNAMMLVLVVAAPIAWGIHTIRHRNAGPDLEDPIETAPPKRSRSQDERALWRTNPLAMLFLGLVLLFVVGIMLMACAWSTRAVMVMSRDVWRARHWVIVQARVLQSEVITISSSRRMNHYNVYLKYAYSYAGQPYEADRLVFTDKDDSGDADIVNSRWMNRTMKSINSARVEGRSIPVFVNPADPTEAVVDRGMVWWDYCVVSGVMILFSIVPIGIITGLCVLVSRWTGNWLRRETLLRGVFALAMAYLILPLIGGVLGLIA